MITGETVDLKPFTLQDQDFLLKWNNDPEYIGLYEPQEKVTKNELQEWLQAEKPGQHWYIIQTKKGQKVGQLVTRELNEDTTQIGYRVTPPSRNKGYCTAAVKTIINHIFSDMTTQRITAEANPRNKASIRVLEKTGFTQTGYKKKALQVNGVWIDGVEYTLQKSDRLRAPHKARPRY